MFLSKNAAMAIFSWGEGKKADQGCPAAETSDSPQTAVLAVQTWIPVPNGRQALI
jgi:hypothetical protein